MQAQRDENSELALRAADRARAAIETMMKAVGLIGGESTTVIVNAQQRAEMDVRTALSTLLAAIGDEKKQTEALRIWLHFLEGDAYELPVIGGNIELPQPALPTAKRARVQDVAPEPPVVIDATPIEVEPDRERKQEAPQSVRRPSPLPPSRREAHSLVAGRW